MKEYLIAGKLITEDISHREMLEVLYYVLKKHNIHFVGETKEVKDISKQ